MALLLRRRVEAARGGQPRCPAAAHGGRRAGSGRMTVHKPTITILIATYNRAERLAATLDTIALTDVEQPWEVVVVDNNSSDDTRRVVDARVRVYPAPLRYLFEKRQGKSV